MSSAPLRKAFFFFCHMSVEDAAWKLEMAEITPYRADCSVRLQIESGHAHDFVSFCQTA